jgi:ubiquitin-protein ligase
MEPFSEPGLRGNEPPSDAFENEAAISQYLELSNSFSVELIDDEVYNVVAHLSSLDGGIYNIYPITINFKNYPEKPQMTFTDDLLVRIRALTDIIAGLRSWDSDKPRMIVDILKEFETRLMEDSLLENEIEALRREYRTKRITKNRIVVTLTSYGYKAFDVELDLSQYPLPPTVYLPQELEEINVRELEGLKKWEERPQKRIMDVLRSLSSVINNLFRLEFEELLLRMVSNEFDVVNNEYHLGIDIPILREENTEDVEAPRGHIHMKIKVPEAYPLSPPKIEIDSDSEDLKRDAQVFLNYMLKSWSPSMFLADALNRLSLSLSNTSLYKCMICGNRECPTCGLPLLTVPVSEAQDICEVPCIHCKRPYHIHCVTDAMEKGLIKCGYCLSDISKFFKKPLGDIA